MSEIHVLPTELAALVEHIELHESGWWDAGVRRCVLGAVWHEGDPVERTHVPQVVAILGRAGLSTDRIHRVVDELLSDGDLIALPSGHVKVSEETAKVLSAEYEAALVNEAQAFEAFADAVDGIPLADRVEACWARFQEDLLLPLISEFGARTYELLVGDMASDIMDTDRVDALVAQLSPGAPEQLKDSLARFLDPANPAVRTYILRCLTASFFVHAAGVGSDTLDRLDQSRTTRRQLTLFVDTNYLFSILGLHDNPSNEAAQSLLALVGRVSPRIEVRLRVLPITIDETRRVVRAQMSFLDTLALPSNLARAGIADVSQLTRRYLEAAARAPSRLSANDFFREYDEDLLSVLRDKGLDVHNESLDLYRTRQDVIDAIHDLEEAQDRTSRGRKRYAANLHDMVVWHFTADKRPAAADSPLDARYWVVTVDFGLMRHDKSATRAHPSLRFPICLHPAELMQLLQFWIPRDETFEAALVGAIRLPFLGSEFDSVTEKVTIRILQRLSRYETIDDLSTDAVARILENEAVRSVFAASGDETEQDEVIHDALVIELDRLDRLSRQQADQLAAVRQSATTADEAATVAREQADEEVQAIERDRAALRTQIKGLEDHAREAEVRADAAEQSADALRERVIHLEESHARSVAQSERRNARTMSVAVMAAIAVLLILLGALLSRALADALPFPLELTVVLTYLGGAGLWFTLAGRWLERNEYTREWWVGSAVRWSNRFAAGLLGGVTVSFIGAWLYDLVRGSA